ncbi:MAG: formate dehydrogenase accessory sulfurtransferase FdhD [Bosea sp.]|nr:formate dehydrogenase accessory sulfurtransferase FdhD [Bosea sp. (in: a-proteobacteria)]
MGTAAKASESVAATTWRRSGAASSSRAVAVETAVAITYGGSTQAVLMASPADLEDFAIGFTLTEGIATLAAIESVERIDGGLGIEMRVSLASQLSERLAARRRAMAGPVGCGLCGIESLEEAVRPLPFNGSKARFAPEAILAAIGGLARLQALNAETRAVHAAAFWQPDEGVRLVREDVGRHNALDKLAGAIARSGLDAASGAVLLTSRVSVEMVQKTAAIGAPLIVAVSAPTSLAIRAAAEAGITLVAVARADGFEVFTHGERLGLPPSVPSRREATRDVA